MATIENSGGSGNQDQVRSDASLGGRLRNILGNLGGQTPDAGSVIPQMPVVQEQPLGTQVREDEPSYHLYESDPVDATALEASGFTKAEIESLINLSGGVSESTLRRLGFARWLVKQGNLDEFSIRED